MKFPLSLFALLLLAGFASAQNLINNPGFETGNFSSWTVTNAPSGSLLTVIPTMAGPMGTGGSGNFIARFGATNMQDDQLSQTFATLAGQTYTVSWFVRFADTTSPPDNNHFRVTFGGNQLGPNLSGVIPSFGTFTFNNVMATSNSTTLSFFGFGRAGIYLDDVSVTLNPVPETGSTILLLGGACAALFGIRRRAGVH